MNSIVKMQSFQKRDKDYRCDSQREAQKHLLTGPILLMDYWLYAEQESISGKKRFDHRTFCG